MEYVEGLNLREVERANRLSPREALQIVPQICAALQQRPIKGTTDWTRYEIVLDVPMHAEQIARGLILSGRGEAKQIPDAPANLDFEQN